MASVSRYVIIAAARQLSGVAGPAAAALRQRLQDDLKAAMRNRADKERLTAIRSVVSAVTYADKTAGATVDDDAIVRELRKLVRKHQESIEQFALAGHADQAEVEKQQMAVVAGYIPETMTTEQIEAAVRAAIARTGAQTTRDLGKVMEDLKTSLSDTTRAPRKLVSDVAKRLLA